MKSKWEQAAGATVGTLLPVAAGWLMLVRLNDKWGPLAEAGTHSINTSAANWQMWLTLSTIALTISTCFVLIGLLNGRVARERLPLVVLAVLTAWLILLGISAAAEPEPRRISTGCVIEGC